MIWYMALIFPTVVGDTLFIGGCGKFFEGDAQMMYTALISKLSTLPDDVVRLI